MKNESPKCGHTALKSDCKTCVAFQKNWYSKLEKTGFKDIEYGADTVALQAKHPDKPLSQMLYQPVNLDNINPETTAFYDDAWAVYHQWVKEGRSLRDCTVAELFAKQEDNTGTKRGISAQLKALGLKPNSIGSAQRTIEEITKLIKNKIGPTTP